jgi:hypothetical protein
MFTKPIIILILICYLVDASSKYKRYDMITCNMIGNLPNMTITNENLENGLYRDVMKRDIMLNEYSYKNPKYTYVNIDINLYKLYKYKYQTFMLNIKYYNQNIYSCCTFDGERIITKTYSINLDDFYL